MNFRWENRRSHGPRRNQYHQTYSQQNSDRFDDTENSTNEQYHPRYIPNSINEGIQQGYVGQQRGGHYDAANFERYQNLRGAYQQQANFSSQQGQNPYREFNRNQERSQLNQNCRRPFFQRRYDKGKRAPNKRSQSFASKSGSGSLSSFNKAENDEEYGASAEEESATKFKSTLSSNVDDGNFPEKESYKKASFSYKGKCTNMRQNLNYPSERSSQIFQKGSDDENFTKSYQEKFYGQNENNEEQFASAALNNQQFSRIPPNNLIESNQQARGSIQRLENIITDYENILQTIQTINPSDVIMDYRRKIDDLAEDHTKYHQKKTEQVSRQMYSQEEDKYKRLLQAHFENLIAQQTQFDDYIRDVKSQLMNLHGVHPTKLLKEAQSMLKNVDCECKLFKRSLPVYALRGKIVNEVKANQVTILIADCCYYLSLLLPHFIVDAFPGKVVTCASSEILKANMESNCLYFRQEREKAVALEQSNSMQFLTEDKMITKDINFFKKSCIIFSVSLRRTIEADVLLANMRDILEKENDFKLILLVSMYDDISKYKNYFLNKSITVSLFAAPSLTIPAKTMWKKISLSRNDSYTSDVVKTIIAIYVNNEPGDILVFLPTIQDAKTASANLTKKMMNYDITDVECVLLHENCKEKAILNIWNKKKSQKRSVIFTTECAEQLVFPSVCYVIDCGIQRDLLYDSDKNFEVLTTTFISQSRARLRKAFAGAFSNGVCYRLYSKDDYDIEMNDMEFAEILVKNPFNTMVKLFQYRPEDAITVELVDSLPDEVKISTMKLLKNYNAIKDGQLTMLGKDMIKLPFPARYSKLLVLGITWGFKFESVILVAFFLVKGRVFQYSKDEEQQREIDGVKLQLSQNDSDPLTYLQVYRKWKETDCSRSWCVKNCINLSTLQEVENKIGEICAVIHEALKENIIPTFSQDKFSIRSLQEMLFDCFQDNLCAFTGHYKSGYRLLSSQHIAYLHPSSSICQKDLPQLVVFDHILSSTRDFMMHVTSIPDSIIKEAVKKGTLAFDHSDLLEKKLVQTVIEPVGEMLIKSVLLGKKGKKLKDIEEIIKKETNSDFIVVEPSIEKGCVVLYTLPACSSKAEELIRDILSKKMEDILKEEEVNRLELKKGQNKVAVDVKWMTGAKTVSVQMGENGSSQVGDKNKISSSNNTSDNETSSFIQYSVSLTWPRRMCTGIGHVRYNYSDFQRARRHAMESIYIHDSEAIIQLDRFEENQLYITKLHALTTKEDIENTMHKLVPGTEIEQVVLKYIPPFETDDNDLKDFKERFKNKCLDLESLKDFEIVIPKPKDTDIMMKAFINVKTEKELEICSKEFNKNPIIAKPVYRCIIKCNVHIFHALQLKFEKELSDLENKYKESELNSHNELFDFVANDENFDTASLKLLSNSGEIIKALRRMTNNLLEGEVLDSSKIQGLHKLFCHGGHLWLQTLQKTANVFIIDEYKSKVIRLYGSDDDCAKAKQRISQFLEDAENEAVKKIDLSHHGKGSRLLLKAVLKKYGGNLEKYIEDYDLRSAVLDIRSCHLILHGTIESIEKAEESLQELSHSEECDVQEWLSSSQEMCPVCVCPAMQLTFRLEHCGHLYCFECIKSLVEQANFPIQCCAEKCNKDMVLEDIRKILDFNKEKISGLLEKSMSEYIERNRTDIIYCPAPDCTMFYFKHQVTVSKWCCPLCQNEICISCNVVYHHGYSCEMYQGSKKDTDYSFKVWQKTSKGCKMCPKCNTAIEKNEGCNHMTCITCASHFCWLCVKAFPTGDHVYRHLPYCPANQGR